MTPPIISQFRKIKDYYQENGFLWVCRHILTNMVHYNRLVIFETVMSEILEDNKAKIPVNIRALSKSEEDIDRLTEFWPEDTYVPKYSTRPMIRNIISQRLTAGEECFIAEYNGEIIGMSWWGFYNAHIFEPYEKKRGLGPGEALSHSVFCAEDYRGKNVANAVRSAKWTYLLANNYNKVVAYVDPENKAAMKFSRRFGGKPVKTLHLLKLCGLELYFWGKPPE